MTAAHPETRNQCQREVAKKEQTHLRSRASTGTSPTDGRNLTADGPLHAQYDRGKPSTWVAMYDSTRLLLTGATWKRRVSRNLRSTSYSSTKP